MTTMSGVSTSSSAAAPLLVNGLVSGINTSSVIQALLQSYQQPINNLQSEQAGLNSQAGDYQTLNSDMQALSAASLALNTSSLWNLTTASTSSSSIATAVSSPGAQTGSLTFTVDQLAQSNLVASQNGVSSTGTVVTTASSLLLATGGAALGFSGFSSSATPLSVGSHTIKVTQSSAAASVSGSAPLASSTTISSSNNTLSLTVNGTSYNLSLASGTYDPSQLVSAIDTAASTAGAPITASLGAAGALELSTSDQGSAASITVLTSNSLATLDLTANQAGTGTDAVVSVDGTSTTLTSLTAGAAVTLNAPSGNTITATLASAPGASGALLSTGTASAAVVSTGNGSLASVVQAINASGLAVTASAVQTSSGDYVLQAGANSTGLAGALSIDSGAFSSGALGALQSLTSAQDAEVSVGGSSGYQVTSSTDTFGGLLTGTAITAIATGQATVTVTPDAAGTASKVSSLVNAANQALADIQKYAGYNASTKVGGPLMGSAIVEGLQQEILSTFATAEGTSSLGNTTAAGISLTSSGTLTFDQSTFESAYAANPSGVAALFTEGGTFAPASGQSSSDVSFVFAGTHTVPGTYTVSVSQSATQATATGTSLTGGNTTAAEQLTVSQGSLQAVYSTSANESLGSIAAGLNAAFSAAGISLTAAVVNDSGGNQHLTVTSDGYGSAESFSVSTTNSGAGTTGLAGSSGSATFTGTDVAGTINGVAATGTGQVLAAPSSDPTLQGLSVQVNASGISSPTTLGTITYTPGLAQQLAALSDTASNASNGSLTTTIRGLQSQATGLDSQIANYQKLESNQQTLLQNEFATMETTLGTLKNESSQLSSAIAGLSGW